MLRSETAAANKSKEYRPADMAFLSDVVAAYFEMVRTDARNKILSGGAVIAPTTASTQATGAGATVWRVDIEALLMVVAGIVGDFVADADFVMHDTTQVPGLDDADTVVGAIIAEVEAGSVALIPVLGTAATTASGNAVGPTDVQIAAALSTAGNAWVKLCECTINRTADTTVTQTQDNTARPILGVNVDGNVGNF